MLNTRDRSRTIRRAVWIALTVLTFAAPVSVQPASAQNILEALFGGIDDRIQEPRAMPYADPYYRSPRYVGPSDREHRRNSDNEQRRRSSESSATYGGSGMAFCVRTCDGRFFPIQRHAGASSAELCRAFCPASKTMVFSGRKIDHAVAHNGQRYSNLDTAFLYRKRVVEDCTCNGKDSLGLARVDAADDPTLRPGDIVATNDGLVNYRGKRSKKSKTAEFTPVNPSSSAWAKRLSEIKIRPAPPEENTESPPPADEAAVPSLKDLRAQLSR